MKTRLIVSAILIPILLIILLVLPKIFTALMLAAFCAIAAWELLYKTKFVTQPRLVLYSILVAMLVPIWCYGGCEYVWGLMGIVAFFVILFGEVFLAKTRLPFEKVCMCLVAGVFVPFLFSSLVRLNIRADGIRSIMICFVLAFIPDSGAYFAGRFFGKHKLAPSISPKKTVEGMLGGIVASVLGMLVYCLVNHLFYDQQVNYLLGILYGVVGALAATFGDLCFSAIKRQTGIKDFSNLIPGHGGILDRFDSMIIVGPVTEVLVLLAPVVV